MKKILLLIGVVSGLAVVSVGFIQRQAQPTDAAEYIYTAVERGSIAVTVSSTGTLAARETIEVGTQVSGLIEVVRADYNAIVQRGQLLALIETEALDANVKDAQATLERAQAQLAEAEAEWQRNRPLYDQGYISEREFQPVQTARATAKASVASAEALVAKALQNRRNAEIRAPIDGVVIERAVEAGQTVAASFNTPRLFVLAESLDQMEILVDVDESDIGLIALGMDVTFEVPAYPGMFFKGSTTSIRLQPKTIQNVVTYTVVVQAENREGKLLPGMTATVDFHVEQASDVWVVPMAALEVKPTTDMATALQEHIDGASDAWKQVWSQMQQVRTESSWTLPDGVALLWYQDALDWQALPVRVGLTDGVHAEVTPLGPNSAALQAGLSVVERVTQGPRDASRLPGFLPRRDNPPTMNL